MKKKGTGLTYLANILKDNISGTCLQFLESFDSQNINKVFCSQKSTKTHLTISPNKKIVDQPYSRQKYSSVAEPRPPARPFRQIWASVLDRTRHHRQN
jgi:hypothetical protein